MNYWMSLIEISSTDRNILIATLYSSPNANTNEFLDDFDVWLKTVLSPHNKDFYFLGDFIINWANKICLDTRKLNEIINDHGLKQLIIEYTHVTLTIKIDLVISNVHKEKSIVLSSPPITDHFII